MRDFSYYLLFTGIFSVSLFLYGFFPIKKCDGTISDVTDLPTYVEEIPLNVSTLYQPRIGKLVIMIIDALRSDFVSGSQASTNMPYLHSLIKNQRACHVTGRADPPTVTMPRIKALTTGTVPNFVDVVLNFGSSEIVEDNFITQASNVGWKMVFFGDDTWLKLFPSKFARSDGTTSFFVSDFVEVDNNVTRHLTFELDNPDWKIMILHYLGLDHIGHFEGPRSSHIQPKLQEMDKVVKRIHYKLIESDKTSDIPSLLVVCGDHGMKDSGSHGGASFAEVMVPIVMIGSLCSGQTPGRDNGVEPETVSQIDLAPTISVLLGLPIPASNLGKLIPQVFQKLPLRMQLYALNYNAQQVFKQFVNHRLHETKSGSIHLQTYKEAVAIYKQWLTSDRMTETKLSEAFVLYMSALQGMSADLAESLVNFDVYSMATGSSMLWQIIVIILMEKSLNTKSSYVRKRIVVIFSLCSIVLVLNFSLCHLSESNSLLCQHTSFALLTTCVTSIIFSVNLYIMTTGFIKLKTVLQTFYSDDYKSVFLTGGTILHAISLASSSFIEEEHQVWYYLWATFSLILLYEVANSGDSGLAMQWGCMIFLHRLLRKWNQTGDKWATLPDIGDWLNEPENKLQLSFVMILGLAAIFVCLEHVNSNCGSIHQSSKFRCRILWSLAVFYIYCYRGATGGTFMPFSYPLSRGIIEVQIIWCILSILLFLGIVLPISQHRIYTKNTFEPLQVLNEIACTITSCWILLSGLLHRPHNIVLVSAQVLISRMLHSILYQVHGRASGRATWMVVSHVWLGTVFYFFQGNSNSLASIDVASGYIGQTEYSPVVCSMLLAAHTYSAPVLSQLLLVTGVLRHFPKSEYTTFRSWLANMVHTNLSLRMLPTAVYTVLVTFQRYHLFVWTVFSPKLLYEAMHTAVIALALVTIQAMVKTVENNKTKDQVKIK